MPNLKLVIVGVSNNQQREELTQHALKAGLANRLILPGFVSEAELDAMVGHACALLYLSLYEGFGLPVLEAIGRNVPVIASDRTSIPEILEGVPGCFSLENPEAIDEAIISLVSHPTERARWQLAQRSILPRFDWTKTAEQTIAVLESCV